jgi:hypothetical protein
MNQVIKIHVNGHDIEYYMADDVYKMEPESFTGCSKTSRLIVVNKKLKPNEYTFMKYIKSKNEWVQSEENYKLAKLLITKKWVHDNLIKFKEIKTDEDLKIESMKAPKLLELSDNEKFVDKNGNILDIEIRGTKNINNIYFKVKDVGDKFGLGDVKTILLNKDSSFKSDLHYKLFKILKVNNPDFDTNKKSQKLLFLTFKGLTKLLYVSHSKNADHFQDWANNILFTVQMGTIQQKEDLFSNVMGVSARVIKEVFNTDTNSLPCVYLFTLNSVKNLRQSMKLDMRYNDESIVCKYGFTKNLSRRTTEHIDTFKKINNTDLKLKYYSYMDPQYMSKGESDIRLFMNALNINLNYNNMEELVIIPKELLELVEKQYEMIGRKYMGHISELVTKIKELEDKYEKQSMNHKLEIQEISHQLEMQKMKYDYDLLKKELEIQQLKNKN